MSTNDKDIQDLINAFKDMPMAEQEEIISDMIPKRCMACINNTICNALTSYIHLYQVGIVLQVQDCRFYNKDK